MNLTPQLLVNAYAQGIFPMAHDDGTIRWYAPDPRAILPLDAFHVSRRLQRTIRSGKYTVRVDVDFPRVMRACAQPAPGRESTWISDELVAVYTALHEFGLAHSVETYCGDDLVGGLYGVSLRGLFAGESMFSTADDASKVALVHLVERLRAGGFTLLDTQFVTPHLQQFGVVEIPREDYLRHLNLALAVDATFFPDDF